MKNKVLVLMVGIDIGLGIAAIIKKRRDKKTRLFYEGCIAGVQESADKLIDLQDERIKVLEERVEYYKGLLDQSMEQTERLLKITGELG